MIFPEQEELLNAAAFQEKLAQSIADGLLEFFNVPPQTRKEQELSAKARVQQSKKKQALPAKPAPSVRAQSRAKEPGRAPRAGTQVRKVKNARHP
ncbi:MAG: hypothetical protein NTY45_08085 [Elusimicrobia bacterium]|nr:hypothetical protein [Elusimicrobiota bacterium]